jgi:hypothetical protein
VVLNLEKLACVEERRARPATPLPTLAQVLEPKVGFGANAPIEENAMIVSSGSGAEVVGRSKKLLRMSSNMASVILTYPSKISGSQ